MLYSKPIRSLMFIITVVLISGCSSGTATPALPIEIRTPIGIISESWYVAVDGDNDNTCSSPEDPCLTIKGALGKAGLDDQIFVGPGTFVETGSVGSLFHFWSNERLTITGAGADITIIDADNSIGGVFISGTANIRLENLTIQNTTRASASGCVETRGDGSAQLINVILQDCWRSGITHNSAGTFHLIDTLIRRAVDEDTTPEFTLNGSGIVNNGEMIIEGGEISNNARQGIVNYEDGRLTITNTLIQNNAFTGVVLEDGSFANFINVTITNNGVEIPRSGITIAGTAIIADSMITNNPSTGVWVYGTGNLIITTSTISGHTEGHGIYIAENGVAAINEVTISGNGNPAASASLNGVYNNGGRVTITHSTITANSRGAIHNEGPGQLWLLTSNVIDNVGDGAVVLNTPGATMTIRRSLIANNILVRLEGGGLPVAVENFGIMHIENSTISGNQGVGVWNSWYAADEYSALRLTYVTITDNLHYGLNINHANEYIIENTLVVNNDGDDCFMTDAAASIIRGTNIDTDGTCPPFSLTYPPAEILLGPLADNGGRTQTHALLAGSPALDAATDTCIAIDQRGSSRPFNSFCDVGAYEFNPLITAETISAEVTGTPPPPPTTINTDTPCYRGPGPRYELVSFLKQGVQVDLLGTGFQPGWLVIDNPTFPGVSCWVGEDKVNIDPRIDLSTLEIFAVPILPTKTPKPIKEGPPPTSTPCPNCP